MSRLGFFRNAATSDEQQAKATKLEDAIDINLKELGYVG